MEGGRESGESMKGREERNKRDRIERGWRGGGACIVDVPHHSFALTFHFSLDFQASYKLDVPSLCTDFQEDIEFHFTLGWQAILRKFLAPHKRRSGHCFGSKCKNTD